MYYISNEFKEVITELQEESRSSLSELMDAESEKERAKKWVRKCRSELSKIGSKKRGLERILQELDVPSKVEVHHE